MRSVKFIVAAGAASLLSSVAFAADMPSIMPAPAYAPPPVEDFGGWYLRGDIGMTNQQLKSLGNPGDPNASLFTSTGMGFDSAALYDLGVGYQFNNWFRADVIGQWRGRSNFHGSQSVPVGVFGPTFTEANNYSGSKSEAVILANAYVDLGTWWCVTPYIGAGIGGSYNRVSGFQDNGVIYNGGVLNNSVTYAGDAGKWNFAWALHAGLAYRVTQNVTLELGYSYMNLGDAVTGPTNSFDGVTVVNGSPFVMKSITSNDVKLGVRWNLDSPPVYAPPPLVTKG
ncbi:outer membrane protein [Bradyrhizobium canariense]|uniref:Opacity protein n=1 Tax=Bradyrhizobium canariense TaxID=255045 RepID=A0A1H2ASZ9_9BRAD|nr:outer membrane beta-barrel protein [Bradyrhizobium canariense]SDT49185.1 Opacity protein [Bradyrhizobium canariense]